MTTQTQCLFLSQYIETALWSSTDENGTPFDDARYTDAELAPETLKRFAKDCERFQSAIVPILARLDDQTRLILPPDEQFAHDFWLTRNHHGAGFWDGDYTKALGEELTKLSHSFGECNLYLGDDKNIHC